MEDSSGAHSAIRARELVAILSPDRKPPLYGQVFQSDAEIERQWSALILWAKGNGAFLSADQVKALRSGKEGGGEEHFVYFDKAASHVIKETRPDSWANKATAGAIFSALARSRKTLASFGGGNSRCFRRFDFHQTTLHRRRYLSRSAPEAEMKANGWERTGPNRFRHHETGAVITDAKPSNVIRGRDGAVWPFDVVVESTGSHE